MKITMKDGAVPFVITFRKILQRPKIKRKRQFVGPGQFVKNMLLKALEMVDDAAFETITDVEDPGKTVAVHWAVSVEDPWDVTTGEANLIAYRMDGDRPPCGAHFEIISPEEASRPPVEQGPTELTPEAFDRLAERMRVGGGHQDMHQTSGPMWRRPADPAYSPRPVEPLLNETQIEESHSEDVEDLDWAGEIGEDDEGPAIC